MPRVIACANCGARYKLPDTFQGAKARCKGCGAVIEVESSVVEPAQREARAEAPATSPSPPPSQEPKAPKPSRPAHRTSRTSSSRSRPAGGRSSRRGRGGAKEAAEDEAPTRDRGRSSRSGSSRGAGRSHGRSGGRSGGHSSHGRRPAGRGGRRGHGEDEEPSNSKTGLILGIAGVAVAAIVTVIVLNNQGDNTNKGTGEAGQQQKVASQPEKQPVKQPEAVAKNDDNATEGTAKTDETKAADATAKGPKDKADKPKTAKADAAKKPASTPEKKISAFDAKTLDPIPWPEDIDEATRKRADELANTAIVDLGIQGKRAAEALGDMGRAGFVAIINRLRTVNYFDEDESDAAFALNEVIEKKLIHRNMGYKARGYDPIKKEDAWWNAKIVHSWMDWFAHNDHSTPEGWEAWQKYVKEVRKKDAAGRK